MKQREFKQVDVFGNKPYFGNPLAVVLDGKELSGEEMQCYARWMNLSETTFLLPPTNPEADYQVRIFTPVRELPFAGHPTLGSCYAWLKTGNLPESKNIVVQECKAGLVRIKRSGNHLAFAAPNLLRSGAVDAETVAQLGRGLGLPESELLQCQWVDNGPGWVGVMLRSAEQVLNLTPDYTALSGLEVGVVGPYPEGSECHFEVRALITKDVLLPYEDPVTGSLNASLGQWLIGSGLAPERYVASQGTVLGREGRVYLERDQAGQVWVGGNVTTCVEGTVLL